MKLLIYSQAETHLFLLLISNNNNIYIFMLSFCRYWDQNITQNRSERFMDADQRQYLHFCCRHGHWIRPHTGIFKQWCPFLCVAHLDYSGYVVVPPQTQRRNRQTNPYRATSAEPQSVPPASVPNWWPSHHITILFYSRRRCVVYTIKSTGMLIHSLCCGFA